MDDLSRARWSKKPKPRDHSPRTALEAALEEYDKADHKPDHIIIIFGRQEEDGACGTRFFQAGTYNHHGQMGLAEEGKLMIRESGLE